MFPWITPRHNEGILPAGVPVVLPVWSIEVFIMIQKKIWIKYHKSPKHDNRVMKNPNRKAYNSNSYRSNFEY